MKKRMCWILLACLLLSFCGCGNAPQEDAALQPESGWQVEYDLGVQYLSEGSYEKAIVAFTLAIKIDPARAEAYALRSDAYAGLGNYAAAIADCETAAACRNDEPDYYLRLSELYVLNGDADRAAEVLEEGLNRTGDSRLEAALSVLAPPYDRLEAFLQSKDLVQSFTDVRPFVMRTEEFDNGYVVDHLELEPYALPEGVLAHYLFDFDQDGTEELFTAEVTGSQLDFCVYSASDGAVRRTDSVAIDSDFMGITTHGPDCVKLFLKEHEGETYVFYERLMTSAYNADGVMFYMKGYAIEDGALAEVMNVTDGGSYWGPDFEKLQPLNETLAAFGFAPVCGEGIPHVDFSVAVRSGVTLLAVVEQRYNGSIDSLMEYYFYKMPDLIEPLDLSVQANLEVSMEEPVVSDFQWVPVGNDFEVIGLCYEAAPRCVWPVQTNTGSAVKNGYYVARRSGAYGLIDLDGEWFAPAQYESICYKYGDYGTGNGAYILDDGLPHPDEHGQNGDIREWALYEDGTGMYQETFFFDLNGMSVISWDETHGFFIYQWGNGFGGVTTNYDFQGTIGVSSLKFVQDLLEVERYGFTLQEGDDPGAYYTYGPASERKAIATDGVLMTDFIFEDVRGFSDGLIAVKQDGKWGYADREGNLVIPCAYVGIRTDSPWDSTQFPADCTEGYVVLSDGSQYALYDNTGREVIPFGMYECLTEICFGKMWAKKEGTWGILILG